MIAKELHGEKYSAHGYNFEFRLCGRRVGGGGWVGAAQGLVGGGSGAGGGGGGAAKIP